MVVSDNKFTYTWEEAYLRREKVGGKGLNLGRLHLFGFPVAKGFVLATNAYSRFLEHNGLFYLIEDISDKVTLENLGNKETISKLKELQDKINSAVIPETILDELQQQLQSLGIIDKPLAVRSSASQEDSKDASFAGIHDSFLNVKGSLKLLESIKGCYASLWTPRAVGYRRKLGVSDSEIKQAVVIMEMVEAKASGVAFSCNPLDGRPDTIVINANFGLGESVVSGAVEPDQYKLVTKMLQPEIYQRYTGKKEGQTIPQQDGGVQFVQKVSQNLQKSQVLDDKQIESLGLLVKRVFDSVGGSVQDQDIEWVYNGVEFIIVQTRPVTKVPKYTYPELKGQAEIWSNANIKDAMPMVQTVFGWQFLKRFSEAILSTPLKLSGYKSLDGLEYSRLVNGRGYFNLSLLQWEFFDAFGITPKETNDMMGGHQPEITVSKVSSIQKLQKMIRTLKLLKEMLQAQSKANQAFERVTSFTKEFIRRDLSKFEDLHLVTQLQNVLNESLVYTKTIALVTNLAGLTFNNLVKVLDKDFPKKGSTIINKLLLGRGNITSAEHGYRLIELADIIKNDKDAYEFFTANNFEPLDWDQRLSEESIFKKAFGEFLDQFGHRGIYEGDISNPRWREDPSYLLNYLRSMISHSDFIELKAKQKQVSDKAWSEIMGQIAFYRRGIVKYFVKQTIKATEMREMAKSQLVRTAEPARLIALEMGKRFVDMGLLEDANDIFHCSWSEAISILKGEWDGQGIKAIICMRKEKMEANKEINPLDTIIDGIPQEYNNIETQSSSDFLTGLGVAAGKAEGMVRVIKHPQEGDKLKPGEILVAPTTDPAWTPLFLKAAGIVMETGGFLSHGAIVSREYGIPAVVNVSNVMNKLKDGDLIIVDGDEGKVYLK